MDWDAMHDLGPQEIPRDHYLLATLRPSLQVQSSSLSGNGDEAESSPSVQVIVLACGIGPAINDRHASYDVVEEAATGIAQRFCGPATANSSSGDADLAAVFAATQQRMRHAPLALS